MNVAFLANTYHLTKTRSSQFFIDLLNQWFGSVAVIAHQDVWASLPGTRWDLIVVWQHRFSPRELEAFGARSVVLVPMYDDCPKDHDFWIAYRGFKVLCFSSALADLLEPWGLECLRVSYRPPVPSTQASFVGGLRGFFWPRTDQLDWRQIGPLASTTAWESFHLHTAHAPATAVLPLPGQIQASDFVQTDWFDRPEDYQSALSRVNVFFAPRLSEGIGMAFLEALALGQCVVAPDLPTANQYIVSGTDGILFDPDQPQPLDLSNASSWGGAARTAAEQGRREWERGLPVVRAFLENLPAEPRRGFHPWVILQGRGTALLRKIWRWMKGTKP